MILKNATDEEINIAIVASYYESFSKILQVSKFPDPTKKFNIKGYISGIPYMLMNSLFDGFPGITKYTVSEVINYYKENQIPLMWFVSPTGFEYGLDDILNELGVELATMKSPGMCVDLSEINDELLHDKLKGINIQPLELENEDHITAYTNIYMKAFNVDPKIEKEMQIYSSKFPNYPSSSHFVIIKDNKFVATASVLYESGVAGVHNVCTLPEYQRQGFASTLMAKLMLDAKQKGYQYSILHSSEKGKTVYERLGYEVKFWFKRYLLRPKDVGL